MKQISDMLKKAQKMQNKMQKVQDDLVELEIIGKSGAGIVKVVLNGKGQMRSISIDKSIINTEEKEVLEDLIVAAYNDAKSKLEISVQEKMQDVTGGMHLPENLKGLF